MYCVVCSVYKGQGAIGNNLTMELGDLNAGQLLETWTPDSEMSTDGTAEAVGAEGSRSGTEAVCVRRTGWMQIN